MIREKEVMQIIKKFAQSPEGKKAIKRKYGVEYDEDLDSNALIQFGEKMKAILVADETMGKIHMGAKDIVVGKPIKTKNGWQISISFVEESLKRESLYDDYLDGYWGDDESRKTPEGDFRRLQDIVLLFTRGYTAKNYVYDRDYSWNGGRSKLSRPPDPFLRNCIDQFNSTTPYYVTAMFNEEYINKEV